MRLMFRASGIDTGVPLFELEVNLRDGGYRYQSRAVEEARGRLSEGDAEQLRRRFEDVNWDLEVLNAPMDFTDDTRFELSFAKDGHQRTYIFSEAMEHRSFQFMDLVHFLRHNVATAGEPVGRRPDERDERPPAHAE